MFKYVLQFSTPLFVLIINISGSFFLLSTAEANSQEGLDLLFSQTPYLRFTEPPTTQSIAQELLDSMLDSDSNVSAFRFIETKHAKAILKHLLQDAEDIEEEDNPFFIQACYVIAMLPSIPGKPFSPSHRADYLRRAHKKLTDKERTERLSVEITSADECYTRFHLWKYPPTGITPNIRYAEIYRDAAIELYTKAIEQEENDEINIKNHYRLGCCLLQRHPEDKKAAQQYFQQIKDLFPLTAYQLAELLYLEKQSNKSIPSCKILCERTSSAFCPRADVLLYHLLKEDPLDYERGKGKLYLYKAALACHPEALLTVSLLNLHTHYKQSIQLMQMAYQYGSEKAAYYLARQIIPTHAFRRPCATFFFLNPSYGQQFAQQNDTLSKLMNGSSGYYHRLDELFNAAAESWDIDVLKSAKKWYQSGYAIEHYPRRYHDCQIRMTYARTK